MYMQMYTLQMPKIYSVAAARARLPEILDAAESGKEVGLSRRGRLVAVVLSGERYEALKANRTPFVDSYRNFMQRHTVAEIGLAGDYFDALRDSGKGRRVRV